METFEIDTELTRDAIYAGIWTRLCAELRGPEEGHRLHEYIERLAVGRGDAAPLLGYLDEDINSLTEARRRLPRRATDAVRLDGRTRRRAPLHAKGVARGTRSMDLHGQGDQRDRGERGPSVDGSPVRKRRAIARSVTQGYGRARLLCSSSSASRLSSTQIVSDVASCPEDR